jgi:hypothetical protein
MNILLNFIKMYQLVQESLVGKTQTGGLTHSTVIIKASILFNKNMPNTTFIPRAAKCWVKDEDPNLGPSS